MNFDAVIFDMDGVLFDSARAHARAYNLALEEVGVPPVDYQDLAGKRTDLALREIFQRQTDLPWDAALIDRLTRRKRELANRFLAEDPPVVAGCGEMLAELARRYKIALASSASRKNIKLFLDSCPSAAVFGAVVSGEDVAEGKPAPDIYLKAMSLLGCDAHATLVVEDSRSGVAAGLQAGARVLGIPGTCSAEELSAAGTLATVEDIRKIPEWLHG